MAVMLDITELEELRDIVVRAADEELMGRFETVKANIKADGTLVTAADFAMQQRLQRELANRWPQFALLGEEMSAQQQQALLGDPGVGLWCLDPLDGTSNFASGIPFFAVSLALIVDGRTQAGIVYDPARRECFSALRGKGAWLNRDRLSAPGQPVTLRDSMAMVDFKRLPEVLVRAFAQRAPYRSQRSFGSVALDWCWIASGRCQVYLHGGQKLWDYAAGQLILDESGAVGGLLDDYNGAWLEAFSLTPRIAIAATHPVLLAEWRNWIGAQFAP
jgi:myo-inositol-1(or 4)-monophosphatase